MSPSITVKPELVLQSTCMALSQRAHHCRHIVLTFNINVKTVSNINTVVGVHIIKFIYMYAQVSRVCASSI